LELIYFESHAGVVAALAPATPNFDAQGKYIGPRQDKPGHDRGIST